MGPIFFFLLLLSFLQCSNLWLQFNNFFLSLNYIMATFYKCIPLIYLNHGHYLTKTREWLTIWGNMFLICIHNIFFSACSIFFWFVSFQWIATDNHSLKLQSVPQIAYCMTHHMTPLIYITHKPIDHFLWYLYDAILSFWSFDSPSFHSLSLFLNRVQYTQCTKSHNGFRTSWRWVNDHHFHFLGELSLFIMTEKLQEK